MGLIPGQDRLQMPLAEDQHPVGDLGPGGEHEPFRISVRPWATRRDLHGLDTGAGLWGAKTGPDALFCERDQIP
jgi:hypothetical protein